MGFNSVLNKVFNFFILKRMKGIHYFMNHPFEVQNKVLFTLLEQAKNTEYGRLNNFGEIKTGKTPSTTKKSYYGGHIPFVKIPDMHNRIYPIVTETTLTSEGANTQKNQFIPKNSIMVSCIGTVGLVNISIELCQTNQQINSIMPNDEKDLYYLYSTM